MTPLLSVAAERAMRQLLALLVTGTWPAAQTWTSTMTGRFSEVVAAVGAAGMPASSPALGTVPVAAYLDDRHASDAARAAGVPVQIAIAHTASSWSGPAGFEIHVVDLWLRVEGPSGDADMTSALVRRYMSAIQRGIWLTPSLGATSEWLVACRQLGAEYAPADDAGTTWAIAVLHLEITTQTGVT